MYSLSSQPVTQRPPYSGGPLKIGAFGAIRPQKNFVSAAGAALAISRQLSSEIELWLTAGRTEGGGDAVLSSVQAMFNGVNGVKLVPNGWGSWFRFKKLVGSMHLLLQPSYTESFNMVTADGVDLGVPSVVSDAISWAPDHLEGAYGRPGYRTRWIAASS
jgi:glycosyltransferase involved in cell wall biosynthesis